MIPALLGLVLVLLVAVVVLLLVLLRRQQSAGGPGTPTTATAALDLGPIHARLDGLDKCHERAERLLREEFTRHGETAGGTARVAREELAGALTGLRDSVEGLLTRLGADQGGRLDRAREQADAHAQRHREENALALRAFGDSLLGRLDGLRDAIEAHHGRAHADSTKRLDGIREDLGVHAQTHREEVAHTLGRHHELVVGQLSRLTDSNAERLETLRGVVDGGLRQVRTDNAEQLERMRATVDEKLQGTLERRLGESFRIVSDRLEQVHQGLGAMQQLAADVGGLQRVLTNVKTRGGWGEVQLGALLEQVLTPEQYSKNVKTKEDSDDLVEYAVKLPGGGPGEPPVWLPIDAKFPVEDYSRLVEAQERADGEGVEAALKGLEVRLKGCAKDICSKYLNPPRTTDFGIMFLPTEGLYAEAVRRIGLCEQVQRDCRVIIAGPTTLAALLNSLQMGFRTLAIQKRSSEVWNLLGAVKTEFGKFGGAMDAVRKKLDEASRKIGDVEVRSRVIQSKLRGVQELPVADAALALGGSVDGDAPGVSALLGLGADDGEALAGASGNGNGHREGAAATAGTPELPLA